MHFRLSMNKQPDTMLGGSEYHEIIYHIPTMKQKISHWIPAAFCAFICLNALFFAPTSPGVEWWKPVFFSFLPMCFYFVVAEISQMQKEIRELRKQVTDLQSKHDHVA